MTVQIRPCLPVYPQTVHTFVDATWLRKPGWEKTAYQQPGKQDDRVIRTLRAERVRGQLRMIGAS